MGLMDKLKGIVNPDTIDDNYDDEYVFDETEETTEYGYEDYQQQPQQQAGGAYQQNNGAYQQNSGGYQQQTQPQPRQQYQQTPAAPMGNNQHRNEVGLNSLNNLELKIVNPERYDSVRQIADHLLNRRTVVLNLESASKEDARRMVDFLSGVVYSINGDIKRINSGNTFILAPNNVDMSTEQQINQQAGRGMFQ